AWLITTEAVLCPTPGKASRPSKVLGNSPPCFSSRIRERFHILRLLVGDKPTFRMTDSIRSGVSFAMAAGVSAISKRVGVELFTDLSVVCAESKTAMHKVYGLVW